MGERERGREGEREQRERGRCLQTERQHDRHIYRKRELLEYECHGQSIPMSLKPCG